MSSLFDDVMKLYDQVKDSTEGKVVVKIVSQYLASGTSLDSELAKSNFSFKGIKEGLEFSLKTKNLGSLSGKLKDVGSGNYDPVKIVYKDMYGNEYYLVGEMPTSKTKKK